MIGLGRGGPFRIKVRRATSIAVRNIHYDTQFLVIGAGVVGLAVGERISRYAFPGPVLQDNNLAIYFTRSTKQTLVLEANKSFGMETSSRNSEVIHAGIYYPKDTLKTKLCIEGKEKL